MAQLLGNSTNTVGPADNTGPGGVSAVQFTCIQSGVVDTIQMFETTIADAGVTSVWLGIYTDLGTTPGTLLSQKQFVGRPPANNWFLTSGLAVPLLAGTVYWLGFDPVGGNIFFNDGATSGGTRVAFPTVTHPDLSGAITWNNVLTTGPLSIYATGTPTPASGGWLPPSGTSVSAA